jgi:hypothetical protein
VVHLLPHEPETLEEWRAELAAAKEELQELLNERPYGEGWDAMASQEMIDWAIDSAKLDISKAEEAIALLERKGNASSQD